MAGVATIGPLQERSIRCSETAAEQLQGALNSRIIIEQAKGKLPERLSIDMHLAFRLLRDYARNSNHAADRRRPQLRRQRHRRLPPAARQPRGA